MPRRPHRKSRNGCLACKKRHVKCNEARPSCLNCVNAELTCIYQNKAPPPSSSHSPLPGISYTASPLPSPAATTSVSSTPYSQVPFTSAQPSWSPASQQPTLEHGVVNMLHLELLTHARTVADAMNGFEISREDCQNAAEEILRHALSTPYLMHEILSVSATHLSTLRPSQRSFLRNQATELQTSALSLFNACMQDTSRNDPSSDCVSKFVFSSLLGSQILHDTIVYRDGDFTAFIDNFVRYLHVTKGVTLNIQGNWMDLHETGLKPFLEAGEKSLRGGEVEFAPECEKLEMLLKSADLGPTSTKAYESALACLKAAYYAHRQVAGSDPHFDGSPLLYGARTGVYAWPILVSSDYAELVLQRRPEALAILAHYAILLHRYRDSWMICDGGRYMIETITKYLGPYWEPWLASPNEELRAHLAPGGRSPRGSAYY
ncbi:hypothetical protein DL98DRAFT_544056 [Cadophora sp. DSE1049]|nr:hypothetical protein DL98DRAFT_544056 [Cadophora sp. DSE1049]